MNETITLGKICLLNNEILRERCLSLEAKGLYWYMVALPDDWHFSEKRLAKLVGVGSSKIKRVIAELENAGILRREFVSTYKGRKVKYIIKGDENEFDL